MINTLRFIYNHPLNKGGRFAALKRWAQWQVGSRLVPGAVAVSFVNDIQILIEPGMTGATGNIYTGLHEFQDMSFVLHFLRKEDLFIDVGANIGSYTLLASGAVGAKCIAIEPILSTFMRLQKNILLNDLKQKVTLLNVGVGHEEGKVRFTLGLDTENRALRRDETEIDYTQEVTIKTLDNIIGELKPKLIKIDVEGYETNAIAGAHQTLSLDCLDAILIELNGLGKRYEFDEEMTHQKILGYGFMPFAYSPFERLLKPINGINTRGNTLYIKNLERVKQRLDTAPIFDVLNRKL